MYRKSNFVFLFINKSMAYVAMVDLNNSLVYIDGHMTSENGMTFK